MSKQVTLYDRRIHRSVNSQSTNNGVQQYLIERTCWTFPTVECETHGSHLGVPNCYCDVTDRASFVLKIRDVFHPKKIQF